MEGYIREFGYAAILIGTFFEGETVLLVGGFLANRTYLELPWVIAAALVGTLCGDQMYFYLGRIKGLEFLQRRPRWKRKSARVRELLRRHQTLVVFGFRFLYGARTMIPFLIGASKVSPIRFLMLNVIGVTVWAVSVGIAGYLLGRTVTIFLADVETYELWVLGVLGAGGVIGWCIWWWLDRRSESREQMP